MQKAGAAARVLGDDEMMEDRQTGAADPHEEAKNQEMGDGAEGGGQDQEEVGVEGEDENEERLREKRLKKEKFYDEVDAEEFF